MAALAILWALIRSAVDWRIAAAGVLTVSLLVGAYAKGHSDASAACRAADLARQLAIKTVIAERLQSQALDASSRAAGLEAASTDLAKKVSGYERAVRLSALTGPALPGRACLLDAGDADRLRAIR